MNEIKNLYGKRILITGASGFVGQHCLSQGLAFETELHAISRIKKTSKSIKWWQGDLLDASKISQVISMLRPDGIIHMAAGGVAYGGSNPSDVLRVNLEGLAILLDAVSNADITPHVVIAGSGFEYAPQGRPLREDDLIGPNSVYGISKAAATYLAHIYADRFPITVLRLFSLYGPGEKEPRVVPYVIAQSQQGLPIELTLGEQMRDYTYVKDAADGFWHALSSPPTRPLCRTLNLASGDRLSLRTFLEILAQQLLEHGVHADLRFGARPYRSDEMMNYSANIQKLNETLNWAPNTSLTAGLSEMIDVHLDNYWSS